MEQKVTVLSMVFQNVFSNNFPKNQACLVHPAPAGCLKNNDEYKSVSPNAASGLPIKRAVRGVCACTPTPLLASAHLRQ